MVPLPRHFANRAYTASRGSQASGSFRHCAPPRTVHSIPLSSCRLSLGGLRFPLFSDVRLAEAAARVPIPLLLFHNDSYSLLRISSLFVQLLFFKHGSRLRKKTPKPPRASAFLPCRRVLLAKARQFFGLQTGLGRSRSIKRCSRRKSPLVYIS